MGGKFSDLGCCNWCLKISLRAGNRDFRICSDSNSDITSALEIVKSGANLVSDRNLSFSRNLGCALKDFYGHYSPRDLQNECIWHRGVWQCTIGPGWGRPGAQGPGASDPRRQSDALKALETDESKGHYAGQRPQFGLTVTSRAISASQLQGAVLPAAG